MRARLTKSQHLRGAAARTKDDGLRVLTRGRSVALRVFHARRRLSVHGLLAGGHVRRRRRQGGDGGRGGRVRGPPVRLQVFGDVLARVLQLVLVEDHVEHLWRTLRQLLGGHHLDVEVARLVLAAGLDQSLQNLPQKISKG